MTDAPHLPDPGPTDVVGSDPAGPDPMLARQLLRHAETLTTLRRDLDQLATQTADTIADLCTRLQTIDDEQDTGRQRPFPGPQVAWCWRNIGPRAADTLWTELSAWTVWLRGRYPLARRIPACWPEHPEVVEELTALWLAWQAAYTDRDAPLTAAADWHDRWLPGLLHRFDHGPFALDCTTTHHPRPPSAYADPA
jgi:hypothetical protein